MSKPSVDPFDPIALAARLAEARALRAIALAKKNLQGSDPLSGAHGDLAEALARRGPEAAARAAEVAVPKPLPPTPAVLRADPEMRVARAPRRAHVPDDSQAQAVDAPRLPGSVPIVGIVAGCLLAGAALLALRPEPNSESGVELNTRQPDLVLQPTVVQPSAAEAPPLTLSPDPRVGLATGAPVGALPMAHRPPEGLAPQGPRAPQLASERDVALLIEPARTPLAPRPVDTGLREPQTVLPPAVPEASALLPPRIGSDPWTPMAPTDPQAGASGFVAASGQAPVAANEAPPPAPRPAAAAAPQAPPAPMFRLPQPVATMPPASATALAPTPPQAVRLAALPNVSLPRPSERVKVPASALAESSGGRAPAVQSAYSIAAESLRIRREEFGRPTQDRPSGGSFALAVLPDIRQPIGTGPISLWLETDIPSAEPAAAPVRTQARTASPVRATAKVDAPRTARAGGADPSQLERNVHRLLREQLRALRRR